MPLKSRIRRLSTLFVWERAVNDSVEFFVVNYVRSSIEFITAQVGK